jgi:hypothetical protein
MVDLILNGLWLYGGAGCLVAIVFLFWGMDRVDSAAAGAYAMRPLLVPGLVMLWPLVVIRWIALARAQRTAP